MEVICLEERAEVREWGWFPREITRRKVAVADIEYLNSPDPTVFTRTNVFHVINLLTAPTVHSRKWKLRKS